MKLRTTNQPVSWLQVIFLLIVIVYCSCKKTDTKVTNDKELYEENFFKKPVSGTEELNTVIDMLKKENEKSGFVNMLPEGAGIPVWDKLIIEKPKLEPGDAARGIIADKDGNLLIPLSSDDKTLSALLFVMKISDKYEFHCYDNNYAYAITFSDKYTIKEREKVIGLFMGMSNYVFGIKEFKSIPKELFEGFASTPEESGLTKKLFLMLATGTLPDIFISDGISHPTTGPTKCYWEFTGKCNCTGSDNTPQNCKHPHAECPSSICTKEVCYTLIFDNESGPGTDPPPGNPNNGTSAPPIVTTTSNWSNNNGSPLPVETTNLPNSPCGETNCTWYSQAPEQNFEAGGCGSGETFVENGCVSESSYPGKEEGYPYKWWEDDLWIYENITFTIDSDEPPAVEGKLNAAEVAFINEHPFAFLKIAFSANIAIEESNRRYPGGRPVGRNDKADAFRHTYWMAICAAMLQNSALAREYGLAHESEVPASNLEKQMDLHNNDVGISIRESSPDQNLQSLLSGVESAMDFGGCWCLNPIDDNTHAILPNTVITPTDQ